MSGSGPSVDWRRIGRTVAYRGRVVDVLRDAVRVRADGVERETEYDLVHHPGAAAVVPLLADGTVVLIRQFRYAVGGELLEIPAGTLEPGEEFLACARREIEEEIGRSAERWTELASFFTTPGFCDEELRVFLAEDLGPGEGARDPDEHLEVVRMPLSEAVERALTGAIRDAKTIVGLVCARARLTAEGRWPADGGGR